MGGSTENEALSRTRLDAIFLTTLATKKKEEWKQSSRASTDSATSFKSLHWQFETSVKLPWSHNNKRFVVTGRMDYSLWYETPNTPETNMVVVEAKGCASDDSGKWQALTYMGMLLSYSYIVDQLSENVSSHDSSCSQASWKV